VEEVARGALRRIHRALAGRAGQIWTHEEQLRTQLQWQLDVLKFIDQRFRPGVLVTDDEVKSYYDQHATELKQQFPQITTYAGLEPKVRASLEGERLNRNFDQWIADARKRGSNRIPARALHEQRDEDCSQYRDRLGRFRRSGFCGRHCGGAYRMVPEFGPAKDRHGDGGRDWWTVEIGAFNFDWTHLSARDEPRDPWQ